MGKNVREQKEQSTFRLMLITAVCQEPQLCTLVTTVSELVILAVGRFFFF